MLHAHRTTCPTGRIMTLAMCLAAVCGLPATAAGSHAFETEEDFIGDIDTVISATRIRQPLTESPSSVTIIDRDMIVASGAIEVADVLRLVPGIQVAYPQGNQLAVTYHGFGDAFPRSMQVLIDGRSIYQPSFADVDWLFLGVVLEDIERIEVIRGPNSPLYGSNAVSGVINIITRLPLQDHGNTARLTAGNLHTRNGMLRHAGSHGALDYRITLNYQQSDGLQGNINSTNDDRQLGGVSWRGNWHPRPSDEVDMQLGYASGDTGGGAEPQHEPPAHDKQVSSDYEFINWRRTLPDAADISWQFYRNAYDSDDHFRDTLSHAYNQDDAIIQFLLGTAPNESANFGLFDYQGQRYDTEFQYISPRGGRVRTVAGAGLRLNRLKSEALTNRNTWIDELSERLFLNLGYHASSQLLLNFGAMAEHSDEYGSYISPRVNANWLFDERHSVRLSYARARRTPSLVERHFNNVYELDNGMPYLIGFQANDPGLETLTSVELGITGYWLERRLLLDAKLFHEKTEDIIRFVNDQSLLQPVAAITPLFPVSTLINDGTEKVAGAEFQLKYQTAPRDFVSLQISKLDTDVQWRTGVNPDSYAIIRENIAPRYTVSALFSKSLPDGFELSTAYYHVSGMIWLGDGDRIGDYERVDLRLAKRMRGNGTNLMLEGIVQNAGGSYTTFRNENQFDTRGYLRLTLAWR